MVRDGTGETSIPTKKAHGGLEQPCSDECPAGKIGSGCWRLSASPSPFPAGGPDILQAGFADARACPFAEKSPSSPSPTRGSETRIRTTCC